MIIFYLYSKDLIQRGVKMETSYLAERRPYPHPAPAVSDLPDSENLRGEMYNELLVMDEEYDELFRRLFFQARAEISANIASRYLSNTPTDLEPVYREFPDFRQDRDFALWLDMPCDFPLQYQKSIDIKIEQFLIDYVCWRWLETKSPADAVTYQARLEQLKEDIRLLLVRRDGGIRRKPSLP